MIPKNIKKKSLWLNGAEVSLASFFVGGGDCLGGGGVAERGQAPGWD